MKIKFRIIISLIAVLVLGTILPSITSKATPDALTLVAPTACPTGGCAAGQRLNFHVDFSLLPHTDNTPNTQICVYSERDDLVVSESNKEYVHYDILGQELRQIPDPNRPGKTMTQRTRDMDGSTFWKYIYKCEGFFHEWFNGSFPPPRQIGYDTTKR